MKTRSNICFFIYETLSNFISKSAEAMGLWPKVKVFRKNNRIAIGLTWVENSRLYKNDKNLANRIIKESVPLDILLNVFHDVNSEDLKTLPLDDHSTKAIYYFDNIIHAGIKNKYFL